MTPEERATLRRAARTAAESAYAPYSRFRVGAAVLDGAGRVHVGANVENASYGLSLCAERAALASAIAQDASDFRGLAVACVDARADGDLQEMLPCGACRQWIAELAPDAEILICGVDGSEHVFRAEDLLPLPFRLTPAPSDLSK